MTLAVRTEVSEIPAMKKIAFALSLAFLPMLHAESVTDETVAVDPDAVVKVDAGDREKLLTMEGQVATVVGTVVRVGATSSGSVTFINFSKEEDGFVAIVKERELGYFPDGFDHLVDKQVAITGTIIIYKGTTPEIELGSPGQINLVQNEQD